MSASQNINIRIAPELLQRIDENAKQSGITRTEYVLQWLPECYQRPTEQGSNTDNAQRR